MRASHPKVFYYYCYRLQLSVIVFAVQASFLQQSEYLLRKMSWTIDQFCAWTDYFISHQILRSSRRRLGTGFSFPVRDLLFGIRKTKIGFHWHVIFKTFETRSKSIAALKLPEIIILRMMQVHKKKIENTIGWTTD